MLLAPNICVAYFAAGPYFTDAWTAAGLVLAALGWALLFTHIVRQVCAGGSADSNVRTQRLENLHRKTQTFNVNLSGVTDLGSEDFAGQKIATCTYLLTPLCAQGRAAAEPARETFRRVAAHALAAEVRA
jgi:hypothetical protein